MNVQQYLLRFVDYLIKISNNSTKGKLSKKTFYFKAI